MQLLGLVWLGASTEAMQNQEAPSKPGGITFEVFVKNAILKVQKEASGRGKDSAEIRKACQEYLGMVCNIKSADPVEASAVLFFWTAPFWSPEEWRMGQ